MRHRRRLDPARLVAAVLAGLVLLTPAVGASTAEAHDVLVSTSPSDGSTVATTPAEVVLTFDQPAIAVGTEIAVAGPDGDVQTGRPRLVDSTVRQSLVPGSPAGRYTVTWRVTSADGHPVSGTFTFTSTAASGPSGAPATTVSGTSTPTGPATTSGAASPTIDTADPQPSHRTTSGADRSGTSWAVFAVVGLVVLAGLIALLVRLRGGNGGPGHG